MTLPKRKKVSDYEVVNPNLNDLALGTKDKKVKQFSFQSVYNLFKSGFDNVYATVTYVNNAISSALSGYATTSQLNGKLDKQSTTIVNIDASGFSPVTITSGIFSITNISSGSGEKQITINCTDVFVANDVLLLTVKYNGHAINLRSYFIDNGGKLNLFLNVHSNPTEPVLISFQKINA